MPVRLDGQDKWDTPGGHDAFVTLVQDGAAAGDDADVITASGFQQGVIPSSFTWTEAKAAVLAAMATL